MTQSEILTAMQNWQDACNTQGLQTIQGFFNSYNMFSFQPDLTNQPIPSQGGAFVHFYPGIHEGNFVMLSIAAIYDTPAYANNFQDHVYPCTPASGTPSPETQQGGISWQEASERIDLWSVNHQAWINANINSMYNAFIMPQDDGMVGTQHNAFFALKPGSTLPSMVPDLIIEDIKNASISYYDTVLIIPPMGPSGPTAAPNFYLLTLI